LAPGVKRGLTVVKTDNLQPALAIIGRIVSLTGKQSF